MKVLLACKPNPDIDMPGCKGYWTRGKRPRPMWVAVKDVAEARERCINFIACNDLGGGNWTGGEIRDENNKPVAYVSYNGRVWKDDPSEGTVGYVCD